MRFNQLIGLACGILALYFLYHIGQGLITGEILKLSKYGQEIIRKSSQPERFWTALAFWTIGAGLLLVTAIKKIFR